MFIGKAFLNRARGDKLPAALCLCLTLLLVSAVTVLWQWSEPAITSQPQARQKQVFQQLLQRFRDGQGYFGLKPKPQLQMWDARTGKLLTGSQTGFAVSSARFSPDGKMITINGRIWRMSLWSDSTQASAINVISVHQ
jgi:hypothetical protein